MASTLALLRPSAPTPLAGAGARSHPATAAVRVPLRSRFSTRVSLGSAVAAGADTLFADYKPTTAFLFPGQVRLTYMRNQSCTVAYSNVNLSEIVHARVFQF
jgi:hypothetical protein